MDDAQPAKRSPRKRQQPIDVAILYNVDFEDASTALDSSIDPRATIESVAKDVKEAIDSDEAQATLVPVDGDFADLRARLDALSPQCVFNLCETLGGDARLETAVPTVLDLLTIPYTGSPPDALSAALYKDRVKQRLIQAGVPTPVGMLFEH